MVFEFLKKKGKKEEDEPLPIDEEFRDDEPVPEEIPPEMEHFRLPEPGKVGMPKETPAPELPEPLKRRPAPAEEAYRPEQYGPSPLEERKEEPREEYPAGKFDRIELILQKLDTIDARLRFIEEKLRR